MKLRVAYAKSRYKDKEYITPLVVTSYRDEKGIARNKTLANLSKLPEYVVKLIEEALKQGDSKTLEKYVNINEVKHLDSVSIGPAFVVLSILKQTGVLEILTGYLSSKQAAAILSIIVERVVSPKPLSVMSLQRRFEDEAISLFLKAEKSPALNTWYAALSNLEEKRESILSDLFKANNSPKDLFLYDITSSYFEGDTCELADYGYNRDGKKGKKQVVIGIICDSRGCPIWVDVFKGNTSDQTTVKQQLINLKVKLGVEKFTFVGDRGMVTNARIEELEKEGWWESFNYITALTRGEMMSLVEDEDHPIQLELFDQQNLAEVEENGIRYVLCHNPLRSERDRETRLRMIELTEKKLINLKKNVDSGRLKNKDAILKRYYKWINHWAMERFFKVEYDEGLFSFVRHEEEILRYSRLDGCYVIRSNVKKPDQTKEDLRDHYKDLKYVEQAFRTMKTADIQVRPIRHFNETQVRGHIFACFLAYRTGWELRQRLKPVLERHIQKRTCIAGSMAEIWRDLASVSLARLEAKGQEYFKMSEIKPYVQNLLKLCKIPSLENFPS